MSTETFPSTAGQRVLLVDDEIEFVETLAERLRARGLDVSVAITGEEAVAQTQKQKFGAVVLDYAMPGMDGLETAKQLRAGDPTLPFILLTGRASIKASLAASRLGAVDILEKPIDIVTLLDKIAQACG